MAAADKALAFTRQRILDGTFPGGELISEGEVANATNLSRTPVREAFLRLEAEGFLRLYPKRGALVVPVSIEEIESVMETRVLVERHAIERVIDSGADVSAALAAELERQKELAQAGSIEAFVDADREFHRLFVAWAGNPILLQLHDSLRDRQSRIGVTALLQDEHRIDQILDEHRSLMGAVTARDAEVARTTIDAHLQGTLTLLRPRPTMSLVRDSPAA